MPSINFDKTKIQRDSNIQWCICSTNPYYQNFKEQIITIFILMLYTIKTEGTLSNSFLRWPLPSYSNHTKMQQKEYMPKSGLQDHNFYAGHLFLACWGDSTLITTVVTQVCTLTNSKYSPFLTCMTPPVDFFLITDVLRGVIWYLKIVSICITLMERIFKNISHSFTFVLLRILFKSLSQFLIMLCISLCFNFVFFKNFRSKPALKWIARNVFFSLISCPFTMLVPFTMLNLLVSWYHICHFLVLKTVLVDSCSKWMFQWEEFKPIPQFSSARFRVSVLIMSISWLIIRSCQYIFNWLI